jgi:hypothetical protein
VWNYIIFGKDVVQETSVGQLATSKRGTGKEIKDAI